MWFTLLLVEGVVISLLCIYLLWRFSTPTTPFFIKITTWLGWLCCFSIVFLVPADVAMAMYTRCVEDHSPQPGVNGTLIPARLAGGVEVCHTEYTITNHELAANLWRVIYWTSFWLCWVLCPVMQSAYEAGEFTAVGRLKSALWENVLFYLVIAGLGLCFIIYLASFQHMDSGDLTGFLMALANAWGLTLLILCLGFGLVEIPRVFWRMSSNVVNLRYCEFRAVEVSIHFFFGPIRFRAGIVTVVVVLSCTITLTRIHFFSIGLRSALLLSLSF